MGGSRVHLLMLLFEVVFKFFSSLKYICDYYDENPDEE